MGVIGILALAGLTGVFVNNMQIRNIGIEGSAVGFPLAAALIGRLFMRERPTEVEGCGETSVGATVGVEIESVRSRTFRPRGDTRNVVQNS